MDYLSDLELLEEQRLSSGLGLDGPASMLAILGLLDEGFLLSLGGSSLLPVLSSLLPHQRTDLGLKNSFLNSSLLLKLLHLVGDPRLPLPEEIALLEEKGVVAGRGHVLLETQLLREALLYLHAFPQCLPFEPTRFLKPAADPVIERLGVLLDAAEDCVVGSQSRRQTVNFSEGLLEEGLAQELFAAVAHH